jgi:hypothetical protein
MHSSQVDNKMPKESKAGRAAKAGKMRKIERKFASKKSIQFKKMRASIQSDPTPRGNRTPSYSTGHSREFINAEMRYWFRANHPDGTLTKFWAHFNEKFRK